MRLKTGSDSTVLDPYMAPVRALVASFAGRAPVPAWLGATTFWLPVLTVSADFL